MVAVLDANMERRAWQEDADQPDGPDITIDLAVQNAAYTAENDDDTEEDVALPVVEVVKPEYAEADRDDGKTERQQPAAKCIGETSVDAAKNDTDEKSSELERAGEVRAVALSGRPVQGDKDGKTERDDREVLAFLEKDLARRDNGKDSVSTEVSQRQDQASVSQAAARTALRASTEHEDITEAVERLHLKDDAENVGYITPDRPVAEVSKVGAQATAQPEARCAEKEVAARSTARLAVSTEAEVVPLGPRTAEAGAARTAMDVEAKGGRSTRRDRYPATMEHGVPNQVGEADRGAAGGPPDNPRGVERSGEHDDGDGEVIQRLLGLPLERLTPNVEPGEYSERRTILGNARRALRAQRDAYVRVAEAAGFKPTTDDIRNWQPSDADIDSLRGNLEMERELLQLIEGLYKVVNNEAHMSRLRPAQRDALIGIHTYLETIPRNADGTKTCYIDMPPGTGKTGTFITIVAAKKDGDDPDNPSQVYIIMPRNQLQTQTVGDLSLKRDERDGFAKFAPHLLDQVGVVNQFAREEDKQIAVESNPLFVQQVQNGTIRHRSLNVLDEAHTTLGDTTSNAVGLYMETGPEGMVVIGCTATPDFHEAKTTAQLLGHCAYYLSIPEAIQTGQLSPVVAEDRTIDVYYDENKLPTDRDERKAAIQAAHIEQWLDNSMTEIGQAMVDGKGVLVRCPPGGDVFWAKYAQDYLRDKLPEVFTRNGEMRRTRITHVGGSKQKADDLQLTLAMLDRGDIQIVTYVDAVNLGVNVPHAKMWVNLSPTTRVNMVQGSGRALRLLFEEVRPGGPKKPVEAHLINYIDPGRPDQYTLADVFEQAPGTEKMRVGQTRQYTPHNPAPTTLQFRRIEATSSAGTIDALSLQHGEDVTYDQEERLFSPTEASKILHLPQDVVERYLADLGYDLNEPLQLGMQDYEVVADLIEAEKKLSASVKLPELERLPPQHVAPPPVPRGYILVTAAMDQIGWRGSASRFLASLRSVGVKAERFTDTDGERKYFIPSDLLL